MYKYNLEKQKGFILIYTLIIVGIIAVVVGIISNSILGELQISRDESESLKAFYAADTGIECIRYYQDNFKAFNKTTAQSDYNCGVGDDFTVGFNPPQADCSGGEYVYDFTLDGFSNGSCANVKVTVIPRTIMVEGVPIEVCDLMVISVGRNSCSASGAILVERIRWEDM